MSEQGGLTLPGSYTRPRGPRKHLRTLHGAARYRSIGYQSKPHQNLLAEYLPDGPCNCLSRMDKHLEPAHLSLSARYRLSVFVCGIAEHNGAIDIAIVRDREAARYLLRKAGCDQEKPCPARPQAQAHGEHLHVPRGNSAVLVGAAVGSLAVNGDHRRGIAENQAIEVTAVPPDLEPLIVQDGLLHRFLSISDACKSPSDAAAQKLHLVP